MTQKASKFECLKNTCLTCRRCPVGGKYIDGVSGNVFSNMNIDAKVMVVGKNPGLEDVKMGQPFVGKSGEIFEKLLIEETGLSRDDLYLTNTVKCYLSDGRAPSLIEVANCEHFLDREVRELRPVLIISIGAYSLRALSGMNGILKHCGDVVISPRYLLPVVGLLHPNSRNMADKDSRNNILSGMTTIRRILEEGIYG